MNTTNELIAVIESARNNGGLVRTIRKQKHAPSQFYMSLTSGQQLGPVSVTGDEAELNRKFEEAQAYVQTLKSHTASTRKAA